MNKAVINRLGAGLLILFGIGLAAHAYLKERAEGLEAAEFERSVVESSLRQVADLPDAKVISITQPRELVACGWVHLNADIGSVPLWAIGSTDANKAPIVRIPRLDSADLDAWADAAVAKQLNIELCRSGRELPQTPPDAHSSPNVDEAISTFWRPNPPQWVVVPKDEGYLGIRRVGGGGTAISPLFSQRDEAVRWMRDSLGAEHHAIDRETTQ